MDRLHYLQRMALAKITREGLVTIAVLVAILWGCILTERVLSRNTSIETYRVLRQIRYLKFKLHVEPVSHPAPQLRSLRPVVG